MIEAFAQLGWIQSLAFATVILGPLWMLTWYMDERSKRKHKLEKMKIEQTHETVTQMEKDK